MDDAIVRKARRHLRKSDPVMRGVIERVGPFSLKLQRNRFQSLVRAIIAQQISGQAARSINNRLQQAIRPRRMTPDVIAGMTLEQLRSLGLSPQKASYVHDLAAKVSDGRVRLNRVRTMSDAEVVAELVQVKGIGVWTAQMFLIFSLGRPDVFPHDDLGIRMALRNLYNLSDLPGKEESHAIADCWRPYATVASWYCWRSLDNGGAA
ncbi:MAG: DNA-3-methyladenine glycosylase 2 family protein [Planctomycetota bacterium]|nr:MAG: DNA-3-methyladenine glycosylase 2 family protein [Planctomycetota bacterium]REJ97905.1 MAG: DNA-3-methyladenine glycosylase 2 family protein [Planctomycetota bacterium]REK25624.1 MAG: DNA-3-methyladenine glycosylase 2 family protein [Planctomycetota bacterium]REK31665.1 MAG: DNA-3-methyladenine glycosylase 2 family protein [Planctomycetota bacterium]